MSIGVNEATLFVTDLGESPTSTLNTDHCPESVWPFLDTRCRVRGYRERTAVVLLEIVAKVLITSSLPFIVIPKVVFFRLESESLRFRRPVHL